MAKRKIKSSIDSLKIEDLTPVTHHLSTGCTVLDLAIADTLPGGFPAGRISQVAGASSSGKSVLACEPLGSAQRQKGFASFLDSEGTLDFKRADYLFGVAVEELRYLSSADKEDMSIEYFFDELLPELEKESQETNAPCVCAVDSLSAIPSAIELEEGVGEASYGTSRAKSLSKGFRKHIWKLNQTNLALIFIDQFRQKVGVTFGKKTTTSGGEALGFYASVIVETKILKKLQNKNKKAIGVEIGFEVTKNKIAPPYRQGSFFLLFDYGIDNIRTNLQWVKENTAGKVYEAPDGKTFTAMSKMIDYIEEEELEEELDLMVWDEWKELYAVEERKERRR